MRLIDANSVEKAIVEKYISQKQEGGVNEQSQEIIDDILKMLRDSPVYTFEKVVIPFTYAVNWRNVKDELPPRMTSVLCYFIYDTGYGAMSENQYFGDGKWLSYSDDVAFWTDLPDIPKEALELQCTNDNEDEDYDDEDEF